MPSDGHALLHLAERGYVLLTPMQATSQEVALGGSLTLQIHIEAYPALLHWGWEHTNSWNESGSSPVESKMFSGNNWYVISLFYTGKFPTVLPL